MRLFKGLRRRENSLEATIAEGLSRYGDRRVELARWIVTGEPTDIDLGPGSRFDAGRPQNSTAYQEMIDAVSEAEPLIEWRLGLLMSHGYWGSTGPTRALHGLWHMRDRKWPSDDRTVELLEAAGVDASEYLVNLLTMSKWGGDSGKAELRRRPLFSTVVSEHPSLIVELLRGDTNEVQSIADALSDASADALQALAATIVGLLTDTSKKRRTAGATLAAATDYDTLVPHFERSAVEGNAAARAEAIRAWGKLAGDRHRDDVLAFCAERCAGDRSPAVQRAIDELSELEPLPVASVDDAWPAVDMPEPDESDRRVFLAMFDRAYEQQRFQYESAQRILKEHPNAPGLEWARSVRPPEHTPDAVINAAWSYLLTGERSDVLGSGLTGFHAAGAAAQLPPLLAFRLLRLTRGQVTWFNMNDAMVKRYRATGRPTPLELHAAGEAAGYTREEVLHAMPRRLPWRDEEVAAWVGALLPEFVSIIESGETMYWDRIEKYYDAVKRLPELPSQLRKVLLTQGIGGRKAHRPLARAALRNDGSTVPSVTGYLASRKFEERAEAALWLGELGAAESIDALHKAARSEKHDVALGALLTALERLGASIEPYVDRDDLLKRAIKDLAKGAPAAASWLSVESLPGLRWKDGRGVDPRLIEWFVNQAVRQKSPSPSPIVRRCFERMLPADVAAFAERMLGLWLAEDLRPVTPDEAMANAEREAQMWRNAPEFTAMTDGELVAHFLPRHVGLPAASATPSKGLLALVAAGGGLSIVAPTEAYLRRWYGMRASQCKALIEMLAWVDDPAAIQLVLSVGSRFRTKGIQEEAVRQAELLAERKGWTVEDLGYRTVPTGGFEANGELILDYGDRQFTARLADDLTVVLSNDEGKTIKALPAARKDEDEARVKLVVKELADAKKHLKSAGKEQPLRLHEAMCVQRSFTVDLFTQCVLGHPVMGRLATRLVWVAVTPGGRGLFRPLSDGTLLDASDDDLTLDSFESVTLAHEAIDGVEAGVTWRKHFADYEVTPLFAQFGRPALPELADGQTQLTQCRGAVIDDRRLRAIVAKVGFELGGGEDGGSVSVLRRRFVSAGLEARIGVRGLFAMIMEQEVALESLRFGPLDEHESIPLTEVPRVLVVETMADVDQIVAAGEGVVEDWEKRVAW